MAANDAIAATTPVTHNVPAPTKPTVPPIVLILFINVAIFDANTPIEVMTFSAAQSYDLDTLSLFAPPAPY
jgi:hypothetical protein